MTQRTLHICSDPSPDSGSDPFADGSFDGDDSQ